MKKALFFILILMFASTVLTAKTYTASTEHFDIIYSDETEKTADSIFKNCEEIYDEVAQLIGYKGNISIPVYVESKTKLLNAYETQWPYNRIVLYDTTAPIGELSNLENQMVSVFRHELTHALQFEIKPNRILRTGSAIFGDWFSLQYLQLYPSYVEGTAVMAESLSGRGRLNDNATMQVLKQAKIEGKFPSFFQTIGMRDIYPSGDLPYLFGGAFTEYLRANFTEEKLRNFFNRTGRFSWVEETGFKFMKEFGTKEKLMWEDFCKTIDTPENYLEASPITDNMRLGQLKTFDSEIYVSEVSKNAIYKLSGSKLKKVEDDKSSEHQFSMDKDKNLLLLSISDKKTAMVLKDSEGNELYRFNGYRDGVIVDANSETYYLLYRNESQETYIDLLDKDYNVVDTEDLGWGVVASDFCSPMNEVAAFLTNHNGKRNVIFYNVITGKTVIAENSPGIVITSLNASPEKEIPSETSETEISEEGLKIEKGLLTFSWTTDGISDSLVRYGELYLKKIGLTLSLSASISDVDISGGIHYPVLIGNTVTYIGRFYLGDKICTVDINKLSLSKVHGVNTAAYTGPTYEEQFGEPEITHRNYQAAKYFFDGSLLPVSSSSMDTESLPLGLTYITKDPTEKWAYVGSFGYCLQNKQFMALSTVSSQVSDKILLKAQMEFQWPLFKTSGAFDFTFSNTLSHSGETITLSNTLSEYSQSYTLMGNTRAMVNDDLTLYDRLSFTYSNLSKAGMKATDYKGFGFGLNATANMGLSRLGTNSWSNPKLGNIVASLSAKYDFPSLGLAHYSIYLNAAMTDTTPKYVSAQVQLMPLCFEIQNGFSFMGLYFNRFVLDLYGYTRYNLTNSNLDYKATAVAYMTVSEAIGMLAKNNVSLGARADYDIKTGEFKVTFYNSLQLDLSSLIPDESSVKIMEF